MSIRSGKGFFITGIDTNVGKTIVSAVLCHALEADYWKPVQSGNLQNSDTHTIKKMCGRNIKAYQEAYALQRALSPHDAAEREGVRIRLKDINKPMNTKSLIIEGAGGILVPLNKSQTNIDLMEKLGCPVILVAKNYLGSINHTLLSIAALKNRGLPLAGVIISGERNEQSESIYEKLGKTSIIAYIPKFSSLSRKNIAQFADRVKQPLKRSLRKFL